MERLVGLYLLTVCDIRATGPKIWNAWKAQLLEDLFYSTARFLKGKGIDRDLLVSRRRKDALRMTRFTPEQRDRINKFWDNFDVAYFMKHSVRNSFGMPRYCCRISILRSHLWHPDRCAAWNTRTKFLS